ncbi:hypothetical protein A3L09_09300 [Thermococcus profundus]|uniref:Uncharacterized protein n=1 Tax=Thermococcus profundus TaxID=49899 RepID=A0A2Z2MFC6_THEPR|nr:hypothetical protein [Thermococcus profundus]ASJ03442.1 hypothetical protein A3L09_09300 [Thermococcus profundus]
MRGEYFLVPSRLLLLSFTPFKDYEGVIHSGEGVFLVEPLGVKVSVFVPYGKHAEELSKLEGKYVEVIIDPPYFEASGPVNAEAPSITPETPASRYLLVGLFNIIEPEWGLFECGNLRFPIRGLVETQNGKNFFVGHDLRIEVPGWDEWPGSSKPVKIAWIKLRKVRLYGYLPKKSKGVRIWRS